MYKISDTGKYLVVEFKAFINFDLISEALVEETAHSFYYQRNDIWIFGKDIMALQFNDLEKITKLVKNRYPDNATRTKTAIVAPPGLNSAIAEVWAESSKNLPYEIKVFNNFALAEAWVCDPPEA